MIMQASEQRAEELLRRSSCLLLGVVVVALDLVIRVWRCFSVLLLCVEAGTANCVIVVASGMPWVQSALFWCCQVFEGWLVLVCSNGGPLCWCCVF